MSIGKLRAPLACTALLLCPGVAAAQAFSAAGWELDDATGQVVEHLGREALELRGGIAWLPDVEFHNGVIEFDVAFSGQRGFVGTAFRILDTGNYEQVYLRPHQSGNPDALQYTPIYNGFSAWQLYGAETAAATLGPSHWTHVRLVFWEQTMQVAIDGLRPQLTAILRRPVHAGSVGLTVAGGFASAHFSNFSATELSEAPFEQLDAPRPGPGVITEWSVSDAFDEALMADAFSLDALPLTDLKWSPLAAEPSGLTNLARRQGLVGQANTCLARIQVRSPSRQLASFNFGFSDRARVFFNGQLLFEGRDTYASRDYRFLGTLGHYDRLVLPLEEGLNELVVAVSESFGGWGISGRLQPQDPEGSLKMQPFVPPAREGDHPNP